MVAPSYKGETQVASCPQCGTDKEIPSDEFMAASPKGSCSGPDNGERCGQVDWSESEDTDL